MDSRFCSPLQPSYFCWTQTASWAIPSFFLLIIFVFLTKHAPKIQLYRNKNVNCLAILQYLSIMMIPSIDIVVLFLAFEEKIYLSIFIKHVLSFINAVFCVFLMKKEFPRMIRPGVYSLSLRLYMFTLLVVELTLFILMVVLLENYSRATLYCESFRIFACVFFNALSFFATFQTKSENLQPLLFEETPAKVHVEEISNAKNEKNDEENDEYRMTRSQSVMNSSLQSDFNIKPFFPNTKCYNNGYRGRNVSIDIPKVLISHDSNQEIIVLYEIKVSDSKGKALRTIYRRFSEFETLHNEVIKNQFLSYFFL